MGTADKRWHFKADSVASRDEWVKAVKKVVFRCQNEGESVKIAIPLETVIDIEKSTNLEFAETIRVRVYDADEGYSIDEYWLSYFNNLDSALKILNKTLEQYRLDHPDRPKFQGQLKAQSSQTHQAGDDHIHDSTITGPAGPRIRGDHIRAETKEEQPSSGTSSPSNEALERAATTGGVGLGGHKAPSKNPHKLVASKPTISSRLRLFHTPSHLSSHSNKGKSSNNNLSGSTTTLTARTPTKSESPRRSVDSETPLDLIDPTMDNSVELDSRYPPPVGSHVPTNKQSHAHSSNWSLPMPTMRTLTTVPSWLTKGAGTGGRKIVETVTNPFGSSNKGGQGGGSTGSTQRSRSRGRTTGGINNRSMAGHGDDLSQSVFDEREVEEPEEMKEDEQMDTVDEKFRQSFGMSEKEHVIAREPELFVLTRDVVTDLVFSLRLSCFIVQRVTDWRYFVHLNFFPLLQICCIPYKYSSECLWTATTFLVVLTQVCFR